MRDGRKFNSRWKSSKEIRQDIDQREPEVKMDGISSKVKGRMVSNSVRPQTRFERDRAAKKGYGKGWTSLRLSMAFGCCKLEGNGGNEAF